MKAELNLVSGGVSSIVIDGVDLANCTGAIALTRLDGAVTLVASPQTTPTLTLTLVLENVSVSTEGELLVNAVPVTDAIGYKIYQDLKERYTTERHGND